MPEQDDLTLPPPPSSAPRQLLTYQESQARRAFMLAAGKLSAIRSDLWNLHVSLDITEAEETAIEEGEQPESLTFAMRGAIECVNRDNLDGAIRTLEETALLSPGTLQDEWRERKRERTSRGEEGAAVSAPRNSDL